MASASAAGAGDQSNIELRPYGINLTLTAELTHSEYDQAVRGLDGVKTRYIVKDSNPNVLIFVSRDDTITYTKIRKSNEYNILVIKQALL